MAKLIAEISEDLYNTLRKSPALKKVHFNSEGHHFFNVFELKDEEGNSTGELYGGLKSEVREVTIRDTRGKETTAMKVVNIANPRTLIVESLSREEALKLPTVKLEKSLLPGNPLIPGSDMQPATKAIFKGKKAAAEQVTA